MLSHRALLTNKVRNIKTDYCGCLRTTAVAYCMVPSGHLSHVAVCVCKISVCDTFFEYKYIKMPMKMSNFSVQRMLIRELYKYNNVYLPQGSNMLVDEFNL